MNNFLTRNLPFWIERAIRQTFEAGHSVHGDLDIDLKDYQQQLLTILHNHHQSLDQSDQVLALLDRLFVTDLYLTLACAQSSNRAWSRFQAIYKVRIFEIAHRFCSNQMVADEVAESMMVHLYLDDITGNPRIQSYDGRVTLTTWLRAIIAHKVIDELDRKHHSFDRVDEITELPDHLSLQRPQDFVRTNRYRAMITGALQEAFSSLEKSERLLLELLYVEELKSREVAELLDTCKSNITYHLKKVRSKMKQGVIQALKQQYSLSEEAIRECIEEILTNPSYSVLTLIQATGK